MRILEPLPVHTITVNPKSGHPTGIIAASGV